MDQFPLLSAGFVLAYLLGSVPTAVWTGKLMYGIDVRTQGSGNAGATNTFRVLGRPAGIFVLFFDITKGFIAASFAGYLHSQGIISSQNLMFFKMMLGLTAVLGHVFPVFAGFKGGKGVATLFGMVIAVSPLVAGICALTFLLFFSTLHYVSVSSMVGGVVFALLIFTGLGGETSPEANLVACCMSIMLIYTHRNNIRKLRAGTENKMYFSKRVKSEELKVE